MCKSVGRQIRRAPEGETVDTSVIWSGTGLSIYKTLPRKYVSNRCYRGAADGGDLSHKTALDLMMARIFLYINHRSNFFAWT